MVNMIFTSGLFVVLIAGILSYKNLFTFRTDPGVSYIFSIWFSLLAFQFIFSQIMLGSLMTTGIGYVFQWMFLSDSAKLVVAMSGFAGLLIVAAAMKKPVLWSSASYFVKLKESNYPFFITAQIIIPFILGNIISIAYFYPEISPIIMYSWIPIGLVLLILLLNARHAGNFLFEDTERPGIKVFKWMVITAIIAYFGLRILLNSKISIII